MGKEKRVEVIRETAQALRVLAAVPQAEWTHEHTEAITYARNFLRSVCASPPE